MTIVVRIIVEDFLMLNIRCALDLYRRVYQCQQLFKQKRNSDIPFKNRMQQLGLGETSIPETTVMVLISQYYCSPLCNLVSVECPRE